MKVLIIDGYNMIHRSRFSWGSNLATGDYQITYNLFRILKSTVDRFTPDKCFFVLDGVPKNRLVIDKEYKANRVRDNLSDEDISYWNSFNSQKREIISILSNWFPVTTVYHPDYEADDLIYSLSKKHSEDEVVIVSSDTDFIQVINELDSVSLYNPLTKTFRERTEYDYVSWKAMVGDKADNIRGVPRIGKKTAAKILSTPGELDNRLSDDKFKKAYNTSYSLIKLEDVPNFYNDCEFSDCNKEWDLVKEAFDSMNFSSITSDDFTWDSFCKSFDNMH